MGHIPAIQRWQAVRARAPHLLLAPLLLAAAACHHRGVEMAGPIPISLQLREILATDRPSLEYLDARSRLERMGPEVDAALVSLADDPSAKPIARANALILLADRQSDAALPVLRRFLLTEETEMLRSAAVLALQRLVPATDEIARLIRSAVGDPARTVRLNALQGLDIRDVDALRALLRAEEDPEVRKVAMQLLSLFESRGAPLAPDRRGALRTTGPDTEPRLVFRAARSDSLAGLASGDLRVELPQGPDIPLASAAEVVARIVPAFFSPDRSAVIYEADREVRVMDLKRRTSRSLGHGIAPRLIPFTNQFVFLREIPEARREGAQETELRYRVLRGSFAPGALEPLGELRAVASPARHGNASPARWMVVGETPEGFALRGEGIDSFPLPTPIWRTLGQDTAAARRTP